MSSVIARQNSNPAYVSDQPNDAHCIDQNVITWRSCVAMLNSRKAPQNGRTSVASTKEVYSKPNTA